MRPVTFASADFLGFLVVVVAAYWCLPRRGQNLLLLGASLVFYGWIHPWYVLLLLYSATLDYTCGRGMERWPERKKAFLWASVIGNLGLLSAFKYFHFFVDNVAAVLGAVGLEPNPLTLQVLLPIGISFYTFQSMSYSIDVYRNKQQPCRDPLAFLLYVSFFPQLVMGPISRARLMLPQIAAPRRLELDRLGSGLALAVWGAFKKVVVADTLSGFVHPVFAHPSPSFGMVWAAAAGASVMMFADFSGYTDIARGTARMVGFELPENFRAPYLATTPAKWWTRWHITFFQWMGEYVFQPVVLSRWCRRWLVVPFVRTTPATHAVRGVMVTMLLSGLWHGAGWHYIIWGGYFGVIQVIYYFAGRKLPERIRTWRYRNWVLRPLMWSYVLVGEMLFQSRDTLKVVGYLGLNPAQGTVEQWSAALAVGIATAACAAPLVGMWALRERWGPQLETSAARLPLATTAACAQAWAIWICYRGASSDFAYFQF